MGLDPINKAIDIANGCVIGAAMCAVTTAGYSPAIGFVHENFDRAFACDIADLYKFTYGVATAFELVSEGKTSPTLLRQEVKRKMRLNKVLDTMIQDSIEAVDAGISSPRV